jgi:hypothetical protein
MLKRRNAQYVANSVCALDCKLLGFEFSTSAINSILMSSDRLYYTLDENCVGYRRFLLPDELPRELNIAGIMSGIILNLLSTVHPSSGAFLF